MGLNELSKEIHRNAKSKGFYDQTFNIGEKLMLVVSEISEALEADRYDKRCRSSIAVKESDTWEEFEAAFEALVKDTVEDELADAIIRILDLAGYLEIDIDWHVRNKMKYNSRWQHLHGKKY